MGDHTPGPNQVAGAGTEQTGWPGAALLLGAQGERPGKEAEEDRLSPMLPPVTPTCKEGWGSWDPAAGCCTHADLATQAALSKKGATQQA